MSAKDDVEKMKRLLKEYNESVLGSDEEKKAWKDYNDFLNNLKSLKKGE